MNFDPGVFEWLLGAVGVLAGVPMVGLLSLAGVFGKNKSSKEEFTKSEDVKKANIDDIQRQQRTSAANERDIADYSTQMRGLYEQDAPRAAEGSSVLYNLGNRTASSSGINDPMSYFRQMGDYGLGKLEDFAKRSLGSRDLGTALSLARRGYRDGGSYGRDQIHRATYARMINPVSQYLNNLAGAAGNLYAQESARIGQLPGIYSAASMLPFNSSRYLTQPIALRSQSGLADAATLAALQRIDDANHIRGIRSDPDTLSRIGQIDSTFLNTAGQAAGVFGNILGGIMGGGMGGIGGFGGFGGGGQAPSPAIGGDPTGRYLPSSQYMPSPAVRQSIPYGAANWS